MNKRDCCNYGITAVLFFAFALLTWIVVSVGVMPVGPRGSRVGFAMGNRLVFDWFGVNLFWYYLTDWLGLLPVAVACGFAAFGLFQCVSRRSILRVDPDILLLGLIYAGDAGVYAFFELVAVNYRPVILRGGLEPSYPSTHVMVAISVMVTAMMQCHARVRSQRMRRIIDAISVMTVAATVFGRQVSGVHWLTDIIAGAILASAMCMLYYSANSHRMDQDAHIITPRQPRIARSSRRGSWPAR